MTDFLKTELKLTTFRNSGYFQFNKEIGNFTLNAGTRGNLIGLLMMSFYYPQG